MPEMPGQARRNDYDQAKNNNYCQGMYRFFTHISPPVISKIIGSSGPFYQFAYTPK
jgi:hypothetical protein